MPITWDEILEALAFVAFIALVVAVYCRATGKGRNG
jgi:hypothetical protein